MLAQYPLGGEAMNWEALSAVAELTGAAGVVASLLYLAAQVHAGNRASAVQAKLASTQLLNDFMDLLIQRPELNQLMLKGLKRTLRFTLTSLVEDPRKNAPAIRLLNSAAIE